jgi:splicing factor U2AF subunit
MDIREEGESSDSSAGSNPAVKRPKGKKTRDAEFGHLKRELLSKLRLKHSIRKLIVSSIPLDSTIDELKTFFETAMRALAPESQEIVGITIAEDKTHAVLEFGNKEDILTCSKLDGSEFRGRRLKVLRHMAYLKDRIKEMKEAIREKERKERDTANILNCSIFPNHENRVFMGNLPTNIPEEDVRRMVESFGRLKSFSLVKTAATQGHNRGFCFFEFWDPKVTDKAIEQLNGLEMGDKKIKVQRASQNRRDTLALPAPSKSSSRSHFSEPLWKNGPTGLLQNLTPIQLQQLQAAFSVPVHAVTPSRCLLMLNMVVPEDLVDDEEYQEIYADVWHECQKYGAVETVRMPRPDLETLAVSDEVGQVFVKYFEVVGAKRARKNISGKTFNNKTVIVTFYPEFQFNGIPLPALTY